MTRSRAPSRRVRAARANHCPPCRAAWSGAYVTTQSSVAPDGKRDPVELAVGRRAYRAGRPPAGWAAPAPRSARTCSSCRPRRPARPGPAGSGRPDRAGRRWAPSGASAERPAAEPHAVLDLHALRGRRSLDLHRRPSASTPRVPGSPRSRCRRPSPRRRRSRRTSPDASTTGVSPRVTMAPGSATTTRVTWAVGSGAVDENEGVGLPSVAGDRRQRHLVRVSAARAGEPGVRGVACRPCRGPARPGRSAHRRRRRPGGCPPGDRAPRSRPPAAPGPPAPTPARSTSASHSSSSARPPRVGRA